MEEGRGRGERGWGRGGNGRAPIMMQFNQFKISLYGLKRLPCIHKLNWKTTCNICSPHYGTFPLTTPPPPPSLSLCFSLFSLRPCLSLSLCLPPSLSVCLSVFIIEIVAIRSMYFFLQNFAVAFCFCFVWRPERVKIRVTARLKGALNENKSNSNITADKQAVPSHSDNAQLVIEVCYQPESRNDLAL